MKGSFKVFEVTGTDGSSKCQITTSSGTGKNQNLIFLVIDCKHYKLSCGKTKSGFLSTTFLQIKPELNPGTNKSPDLFIWQYRELKNLISTCTTCLFNEKRSKFVRFSRKKRGKKSPNFYYKFQ
jgi:hypothetical protein